MINIVAVFNQLIAELLRLIVILCEFYINFYIIKSLHKKKNQELNIFHQKRQCLDDQYTDLSLFVWMCHLNPLTSPLIYFTKRNAKSFFWHVAICKNNSWKRSSQPMSWQDMIDTFLNTTYFLIQICICYRSHLFMIV